MRFTDRSIKALKPEDKRRDIREGKSRPGFAVRIFPSGNKSFIYIYTLNGVKRRMTLGSFPNISLSEAHSEYDAASRKVENDIDPAIEKLEADQAEKAADTITELAAEYIEKWAKPRKRSWKEDQRILNHDIIPAWGKRKAKDITRRDAILLLDKIVDRGAPIAANRTHALLHKMFRFAVGRDIIPFNPCSDMPKPSIEHQKDRVLSDDEVKTHWHGIMTSTEMSDLTRYALLLQLTTAQRQGEIASMRWDDIHGDTWTIPAERAKNGLAHRVPLSPQAIALLNTAKEISGESEYVFPSPKAGHIAPSAVGKALRRHLKELKEPITRECSEWFTPHDLRRTAATKMTEAGINRLAVSKVLNHAESGVTAVYDRHSYDKEKRQALETWGRRLDAIIKDKEESSVIPMNRIAKAGK